MVFETNLGNMVASSTACGPVTVDNFVKYVLDEYYTDLLFHRVIDGFVAQTGGYELDGTLKPATYPAIPLEIAPGLSHVNGALGMARTSDPNSATTQFYFCDGAQSFLDGDYAVFGVLVSGFDVLATISGVATNSADEPIEPVVLENVYCTVEIP